MISVIIPVKNGGQTLERCLQSISPQTLQDLEIIILDSASTDNSKIIAERFGAIIIDIEPDSFNHGLTRNLGAQHAKGELIYLTVQDAWIAEENMLQQMAAYFDDEAVQSVTGMQATPHEPDKNPVRWFKRFSIPVAESRQFATGAFTNLPASQQLALSRWDNVNSMYRRTALLQQPFVKTDLAEDIIWAKHALEKGWKIVRDAGLVVYHYHHHTFRYTFRISYSEYYVVKQEFGLLPSFPPVIMDFLKSVRAIFKNRTLGFLKKLSWVLHNFLFQAAKLLSVISFRILYFFGSQEGMDKGLKLFCSDVPQGKQK
jgi:glycosyltransferase involved in cell wall biosynthesis